MPDAAGIAGRRLYVTKPSRIARDRNASVGAACKSMMTAYVQTPEKHMSYYHARLLDTGLDEAVERATAALKEKGFGVLTDIDIQATMKKKIDKDMKPYRILGACNPNLAWHALQSEPRIGLMLPCNVIVREVGDGVVEVAAVDPVESMASVDSPALEAVATEVRSQLMSVISNL